MDSAHCFFNINGQFIKSQKCKKMFEERDGLRYFITTPCDFCEIESLCPEFIPMKVKQITLVKN